MTSQDLLNVTIEYKFDPDTGKHSVIVKPATVFVTPGQAIRFQRLGTDGKMELTFVDMEFFDTDKSHFAATGIFEEDDGDVRVKTQPALTARTTYRCKLLDRVTGAVIADSAATQGGAVEPIKNKP